MKTNKHVFLVLTLVAFAAILSGCGDDKKNGTGGGAHGANASNRQAAYGTWGGFPEVDNNGMKMSMTMKIEESAVSFSMSMTMPDVSQSNSTTSVRAEVTDDSIRLLDAPQGGSGFSGSNEMTYSVNGNSLTLSANGQSIVLSRIN